MGFLESISVTSHRAAGDLGDRDSRRPDRPRLLELQRRAAARGLPRLHPEAPPARLHGRPDALGALDPGRAGDELPDPVDQGRLRRLDRLDRRQPLSRHALRPRPAPAPEPAQPRRLRAAQNDVIRIYDIVFDYKTLLDTDAFYRELIRDEAFARPMGTAEFHHEVGRYLHGRAEAAGPTRRPACWPRPIEADVPIYTSSPGDSSIGMNLAALSLQGGRLQIDTLRDVNETAAIVYAAKRDGGKSGVLILGGGSPKNFILQTEPQIQEVLGLAESGHDYFLQITDARPDTGGLSGATASEAMTWGKVDPDKLPDSVTCYTDSTIALPLLTAYALRPPCPAAAAAALSATRPGLRGAPLRV